MTTYHGERDPLTPLLVAAHRKATEGRTYGTGPGTTNCVVAVEDVLAEVYGERVRQEHRALMIADDPPKPWSNIEALIRLGLGVEVTEPGSGWHVVQGWRTLGVGGVIRPGLDRGHSFLFQGLGRVLEANVKYPWDRRETWGEVRARYKAGVRIVALTNP